MVHPRFNILSSVRRSFVVGHLVTSNIGSRQVPEKTGRVLLIRGTEPIRLVNSSQVIFGFPPNTVLTLNSFCTDTVGLENKLREELESCLRGFR